VEVRYTDLLSFFGFLGETCHDGKEQIDESKQQTFRLFALRLEPVCLDYRINCFRVEVLVLAEMAEDAVAVVTPHEPFHDFQLDQIGEVSRFVVPLETGNQLHRHLAVTVRVAKQLFKDAKEGLSQRSLQKVTGAWYIIQVVEQPIDGKLKTRTKARYHKRDMPICSLSGSQSTYEPKESVKQTQSRQAFSSVGEVKFNSILYLFNRDVGLQAR
jgi:hypothetical protein